MITRRQLVKSIPGIALTTGFISIPAYAGNGRNIVVPRRNIKISPPGPKSVELLEKYKKYVGVSEYTGLYGVGLKNSSGVYIEDMDGNTYLDCFSAASCNILGYSHDDVARIYYDTALRIQQTESGYSPNEEMAEIARLLTEITPGKFSKKAIPGLTGSDSNCGAIEAARKFTGKMGIISFNYAYHGSTGLSQAASGFRSLNEGVYNLNDPDFVKVNFPVTEKEGERTLNNIETILSFGKTAAVMVEIIQGDGGTLIPPTGFFARLKEMLENYNVLLIDDEVQSGMGRTGKWWACDHEGIAPDITVIGKGLSAGYAPVSALVGRTEVLDSLVSCTHSFTYSGHAPSAAAVAKVIDIIQKENLIENAKSTGERLLTGLKESEKYPGAVREVRGRGLMIGIEINISDNELAGKIFAFRCLEKGVYFGYIGDKQRVIRVIPPLVLNPSECDDVIGVVMETAEEMHNKRIPATTVDKVNRFAVGW